MRIMLDENISLYTQQRDDNYINSCGTTIRRSRNWFNQTNL